MRSTLILLCAVGLATAAEPEVRRDLMVPFEDLHLLLGSGTQRVLLPQEEFEDLVTRARREEAERPPRSAVLSRAEYTIQVEGEHALIEGTMGLDVLSDGVHALHFPLSGVGLLRLQLGDEGAALGRDATGTLMLVVDKAGAHTLSMAAVAPVQTSAARQKISIRLPSAGAAKLRLTVPGDVEVKSGASVVSRTFDEEKAETRFELLAPRDQLNLEMTLNSRLLKEDRVVLAQSVVVVEVTEAYESLHATVSLDILHRALDRFEFELPTGFEVTSVRSPELARWALRTEGDVQVLEVLLREEQTGTVTLGIAGTRSDPDLETWQFPQLTPRDVVGQVAVIGILAEDRLTARDVRAEQLIDVDRGVLLQALPASVVDAEAGEVKVRPFVAYYAAQSDYALSASFVKRPSRRMVTAHTQLDIGLDGLTARGGFSVESLEAPLFAVDVGVPAGWDVLRLTGADGVELPFERYPTEGNGSRLHVRLPEKVPVGGIASILFEARHVPSGWLEEWETKQVEFPGFELMGADRDIGALAVGLRDDLEVRPVTLELLSPLDAAEKAQFGISAGGGALAYRYDARPYRATLQVSRRAPRLTAESFTFYRIEQEVMQVRHEVVYQVDEARTRKVAFLLPASSPAALTVRGLNGTDVKEYLGAVDGEDRRWQVDLAAAQSGSIHLEVSYPLPLPGGEEVTVEPPAIRADGVVYQSGLVAVEGSADLDVRVTEHPRAVDIGELVEAEYSPGKRLLGAYGFVGPPKPIGLAITRHPEAGLPPVIVQRAELISAAASRGVGQTSARYQLRSRVSFLEVDLPEGATLWSALVNGKPLLPQQQGDRVLVSLPPKQPGESQDLVLVYESDMPPLGMTGRVEVDAPRLYLAERDGEERVEVPVTDLQWHLVLPEGYRILDPGGTVSPARDTDPTLAAVHVARFVHWLAGGVRYRNGVMGWVMSPIKEVFTGMGSSLGGRDYAATEAVEDRNVFREEMQKESMASFDESDQSPADLPAASAAPRSAPARGIAVQKAAEAKKAVPKKKKVAWALEGARSLDIELSKLGPRTQYHSLGAAPRIDVSVIEARRQDMMVGAAALAVFVGGLALAGAPVRRRVMYIFCVLFLSTLLAALPGAASWISVCNGAFYAACLLLPLYVLLRFVRWVLRAFQHVGVGVLLLVGMGFVLPGRSETPRSEEPPPVPVSDGVLIMPYMSEDEGAPESHKVLVPYDTYEALWERAYPVEAASAADLPVTFAWAGAAYTTTLAEGEVLVVKGSLALDVYTEKPCHIPLSLDKGVLARAQLDGAPARIRVVNPEPDLNQQKAVAPPAPRVMLEVHGKGRHRFDVEIRVRLSRRGGWRVADATVPRAPASSLELTVPASGTEIQVRGVRDQGHHETEQVDQRITTVLGDGGRLQLEWRPEVGEGQVDKSLTANSFAVFDIQEDQLRLSWKTDIQFRSGEREEFVFVLPKGYLVHRVDGANVRGWAADGEQLRVQLLKPATKSEMITLILQAAGIGTGADIQAVEAPVVGLDGAIRHTGRMVVRRTPLLDLRMTDATGVQRINLTDKIRSRASNAGLSPGPLGIRALQSYEFVALPFQLNYSVSPLPVETEATVQTILRVSDRERRVESRIELDVRNRPVYQMAVDLPSTFTVEDCQAPGEYEWTTTDRQDGRRLMLYFAAGVKGKVPVVLRGRLGETEQQTEVSLPGIDVQGVERQQGEIVVQTDPSYDVKPAGLVNVEPILLNRVFGWLIPEQRKNARLALAYREPDIEGTIQLRPRKSQVRVFTVTNARITDRAIEESVLLNFSIRNAGLRQIEFDLPAVLADARIRVPNLSQKTITPVPDSDWVRVRLDLQSAVKNQLVVLVEQDRVLAAEGQTVRLPVVHTGTTDARYVALESAGRDEVVLDAADGMDPLSRQQKEYAKVASVLQGGTTRAFLVRPDAASPTITFHTKERTTVETAGARIGLAQATVVMDGQGTYRAEQVYHVDNQTEQYLSITLPDESRLWTAKVAGDFVKPVAPNAAEPRLLHIPLIKTEAGDLDYAVVLKYGGSVPSLRTLRRVGFPFIKTGNIGVELSQVELRLPRTHEWSWFDGTLRQVDEEGDFEAGRLAYQNDVMKRLTHTLQYGSVFSKARATRNLKTLSGQQDLVVENAPVLFTQNIRYNEQVEAARKLGSEAQVQLRKSDETGLGVSLGDNRANFMGCYVEQANDFGGGVVREAQLNWDVSALQQSDEQDVSLHNTFENTNWFATKGLANDADMPNQMQRIAGQKKEYVEFESGKDLQQAEQLGQQVKQWDQKKLNIAQPQSPPAPALSKSRRSQQQLAQRYEARLEKQEAQQTILSSSLEESLVRSRSAAPEEAGATYFDGADAIAGGFQAGIGQDAESTWGVAPRGLASLDVELPAQDAARWQPFRFTTPRGEVELAGYGISRRAIDGWLRVGMVIVSFLLVWGLMRGLRGRTTSLPRRLLVANLAVILGVVGLLFGIYPVAAVVAIVAGFVSRRRTRVLLLQP